MEFYSIVLGRSGNAKFFVMHEDEMKQIIEHSITQYAVHPLVSKGEIRMHSPALIAHPIEALVVIYGNLNRQIIYVADTRKSEYLTGRS